MRFPVFCASPTACKRARREQRSCAPQVEALVLEEMHRIRKEGFSPAAIEAALNVTEFALRENNTGRFPRGIAMMLRAMGAWIYERDPYRCARSRPCRLDASPRAPLRCCVGFLTRRASVMNCRPLSRSGWEVRCKFMPRLLRLDRI